MSEEVEKEMTPAETVLAAIQQAARDMTQTHVTVRDIEAALTQMQEASDKKFSFRKSTGGDGAVSFETNIPAERHQPFPQVRLTINASGAIFTNVPKKAALVADAEYFVSNAGAPPALIKELMSRQDSIEYFEQHFSTAASARHLTDAAAALTEITRMAVFNGLVTAVPSESHATIQDNVRQALDEMALTEILGGEIIDGLEYLGTLSNGGLRVTCVRDPGSSDIVLDCTPNKQLEAMSFRIMADGKVTFLSNPPQTLMLLSYAVANGGSPDIGGRFAEYNALDEGDIARILCSAARSAVFSGLVPPLPRGLVPASAAQKMVLEAVHASAQEATQARTAADEIIHGLDFLKGQLDDFRYKEEKKPESSDVIIVVNPHKPSPLRITVNADGKISLSDNAAREYEALERSDMEKILTTVTRRAVFQQGKLPPKAKGLSPA